MMDEQLRDYFATHAMQSLLTNDMAFRQAACDESLGKNMRERIATAAYLYADAMLKVREADL